MWYLQIGSIIKDEPDLSEWIAYHLSLGVERIVLYDNESDPPVQVMDPRVKVIRWPGRAQQIRAYDHFCRHFLCEAVWSGVLDADEFVLPHRTNDLRDLLVGYQAYPGLAVNWQIFGSNGHQVRPTGLIVENYTQRARAGFKVNAHVKLFLRATADHIRWESPHEVTLGSGISKVVNEKGEPLHGPFHTPSISTIQINHYASKSHEDMARKHHRGSVATGKRTRSWEVIKELDQNEIEDRRILRFSPRIKTQLAAWK
ncbi:MAG: glycosyltransferase family 2 protein [Verrucomicrobiota bacterium]